MSKATTVEKNGRFYKRENGEILTENELLKEWLVIANEQLEDYKSRNEKAINEVIRVLQIILEQPSKDKLDDLWIINKLEGIQTLLQGEDKEC